ncbi:MAG TPA: ABC transporter permease [Firmicutes bacterium]|nr:ABC transporter permease [Bacillota bacterium]
MLQYITRRLGMAVAQVWIVTTVVFFFVFLLPGDPADIILGSSEDYQPSKEQLERVRARLGLDQPVPVQYVKYLAGVVRGDLGSSFANQRPVLLDLGVRLPRSLQLIIPAAIISSILGIALGVCAAYFRGSWLDTGLSTISLVGFSLPVFVTGNIMVLIFAIHFKMVPSSGYADLFTDFSRWLRYAILPIASLSLAPTATIMRMTRASMVEQLGQDYVRTARSKGVRTPVVVFRHVLKNAMLPVVTVIGLQIGGMFVGSLLVEQVFNWPGLSSLLIHAIQHRDYPIIQGTILLSSFIFILINLLTDVSYSFLNPRLHYD